MVYVSKKTYKRPEKPYLKIPKETLLSENFAKLSTSAKLTYIGLLAHWIRNPNKPDREFKVKVSYSKLIETTGLARATISKAIRELNKGNADIKFISEIDNHFLYCTNEYLLNSKWLK